MLKQMFKQKWYIACVVALIFLEPSVNSILNFWLQRIFNTVKPDIDKLVVFRLITTGFLLWMLKRLIVFTSEVLTNRFICNTKYDLKFKMFRNLFGIELSNISQIGSSGEYITAFTTDINLLETRFYTQIVSFTASIVSVAILGSSLAVLNKTLAVAILSFGLVSMFVPFLFVKVLNAKSEAYSRSMSKLTTGVKEYVTNYSVIRNYSAEDRIIDKFDELNFNSEETKFDSDFSLAVANNVGTMLSWFLQFIAVGLGIVLVVDGEIAIGTVIAAQGFAGDIAGPFQRIVSSWNSIYSIKTIMKNIERLSNDEGVTLSKDSNDRHTDSLGDGYDLEFEDVGIEINGKKLIEDFSYKFENGKKYLVVGKNGAGKSTIFKILKRWYKKSNGKILLGGKDISELSTAEINSAISYIDPSPSVFTGTIRDNMALFGDVDEGRLEAAINRAHINLSLDRMIDDKMATSTGEGTKISLSRIFLSKAKIFILDESFANLDIETAYELESNALSMNETVIMIAHNLNGDLICKYDEILVVGDGRLIAHGAYEELRKSCPYFDNVCRIKFGN